MYKFIFITGSGRCGTNVIAGLIDGHSTLDVMAGEFTDYFGAVLHTNGLNTIVNLKESGKYLIDAALDIYKNDDDFTLIQERFELQFLKLWNSGISHLSANDLLSHICEILFNKSDGTAVINVCNENINGLLDAFPNSLVIHMLRNPLAQLNSRYLFRFSDVNSFGGNYPGYWEFGKAFKRNFDSFNQASIFKNHQRVHVLRMEDLQNSTKETSIILLADEASPFRVHGAEKVFLLSKCLLMTKTGPVFHQMISLFAVR